ncbi:hypothetical protein BCON_0325g00070 [Botryotinia convoluta]|uniref:F-box domain-containing protein n=1 Tax=Botryotinia convoluta TaxID=54673 RepID=A0A4Z1HC62_9HELO|nr:hypothetical protein BCON_0325g00070 [Botryotinia convoluta]
MESIPQSHDYEKLDFSENKFEKLPRELLLPIVKSTSDLASVWKIVETVLEASESEKLQIAFGHIALLRLVKHPSTSMDEFKKGRKFSALNKIDKSFTAQLPANHTTMDNDNRAFKSEYQLLPEEVSPVIIRTILRTAYNINQLTYLCHKHFLDRCESFESSEPIHLRYSGLRGLVDVKLTECRKYSVRNVSSLPSWIEQNRITQAFWYIQIFYDLKNNSQKLRWTNIDLDRLRNMDIESFHDNSGRNPLENAILTAALYLREMSQGPSFHSIDQREFRTLRLPRPDENVSVVLPVEPKFADPRSDGWGESARYIDHSSSIPGIFIPCIYLTCIKSSPRTDIPYECFRRLGFALWDPKRMFAFRLAN